MSNEQVDMESVDYVFRIGTRGATEDDGTVSFPSIQVLGTCWDPDDDPEVEPAYARVLFELDAYILCGKDCARERLNLDHEADADGDIYFFATRLFHCPGDMAGGFLNPAVKEALESEDIEPSPVVMPTMFVISNLKHANGLSEHVLIRGLQRALSMFRSEYIVADNRDAPFDWESWGFVGIGPEHDPELSVEEIEKSPRPRLYVNKVNRLMSLSRGVRWSKPGAISEESARRAPRVPYDHRSGQWVKVEWPVKEEGEEEVPSASDSN